MIGRGGLSHGSGKMRAPKSHDDTQY